MDKANGTKQSGYTIKEEIPPEAGTWYEKKKGSPKRLHYLLWKISKDSKHLTLHNPFHQTHHYKSSQISQYQKIGKTERLN